MKTVTKIILHKTIASYYKRDTMVARYKPEQEFPRPYDNASK